MRLLTVMLLLVQLWPVRLQGLLIKKETCEEILRPLLWCSKIILEEAERWSD